MEAYEFEQPGERLEFTGERYTPAVGDKIGHEHLHRYLFALRYCTGRRVVDVACGEGYGTALLAQAAAEVVGADSSAEAVEHAARTYPAANVVFHAADAAAIPVEDGYADVVVSFETIEHLGDHDAFLAEVARVLRPGGLLVLSTPDRSVYLKDAEPNPFHVRELDGPELTALLGRHFARFAVGGQRSDAGSAIAFPAAAGSAGTFFETTGRGSFEATEELPAPLYLMALASDGELPDAGPSTLFDAEYLPRLHAAYHEALAAVRADLASRDARVQVLATERERATAALAAARAEVASLHGYVQELEQDVASLSIAITSLNNELAETHGALSWQLTAPFRAAARRLRRTPPEPPPLPPAADRGYAPPHFEPIPVAHAPAVTGNLVEFEDDAELAPEIHDAAIVSAASAWIYHNAPARLAEQLEYRPLVSILLPAYNTPPELLRQAVRSVLAQSYREWELVLVDDGSDAAGFEAVLEEVGSWDPRVRVTRRAANGGISAATNTALELATGEFVALLDHDDELLPHALLEVVRVLGDDRALDVVYTDQEYAALDGTPDGLLLKPDWSPTLFRGVMYVGHLLTVRRELAVAVGGCDSRFDNVQDFEFMLRLSERTDRIAHVPHVLYRWRRVPGSVAFHGDEKGAVEPLQAAAVSAHLERLGVPAQARPHPTHAHRAQLVPLPGGDVEVTVVVVLPGGDRLDPAALDVLRERAGAPIRGIVACGDGSLREATAGLASGLVLAIEHGVVPDSDGWLASLALHAREEGVAAVSPLVLGPEGPQVVDAGVILGLAGEPEPAMSGWDSTGDGYAGSLSCAREVSAVSGACALIAAETLQRLGGFSELFAGAGAAWLDLSLRAREAGLRNVVTPRAVVRRTAAATADPLDRRLLRDTWPETIAGPDPYHNPNFAAVPGGYGQ